MSISGPQYESEVPSRRGFEHGLDEQKRIDVLTAELLASIAREKELLVEHGDLVRRQREQSIEFDRRLFNGLHMIGGLLSRQSRTASSEAAAQLTSAAGRVAAFGRVHRQLHALDHQNSVELSQYLRQLCNDLTALLFPQEAAYSILVESADCRIATALGIPLAFIANELITNSAKYANGNIIVRFETTSPACHSLSVLDDGPGLPPGFDPVNTTGFGLKIVRSLVKRIGGELCIRCGDNGRGARFTVTFRSFTRVGTLNSHVLAPSLALLVQK